MPDWTLQLLGDCRLLAPSGEEVKLATRKASALLALVALHGETGIGRQRIAAMLWEDSDSEAGRLHVRKALWHIRSACASAAPGAPPPILADGDQLRAAAGLSVDALSFAAAAQEAGDDPRALASAAAQFTGELLGDFAVRHAPEFDEWAERERQRLHALAADLLLRLTERLAGQPARVDEAIASAERLVALDPLHERGYRLLMELQWRAGRSADALRHYRELEERLRRELDVAPEHATIAVRQRIEEERAAPAPVTPSNLAEAVTPAPRPRRPRRRRTLLAGTLIAALAASGAAAIQHRLDRSGEPPRVASIFPIVPGLPVAGSPALSGDGSRLVFAGRTPDGGQDLFLLTLGARQPLRLTSGPAAEDRPAWSPDGTSIAFTALGQDQPACRLMVMAVPGGTAREVARCQGVTATAPAWSADGRALVIADAPVPGASTQLFEIGLATGRRVPLTNPRADIPGDRQPLVGGGGRLLAFVRLTSADTGELMLLDRGSGALTQLTRDGASIGGLTFAADGRGLLFSSDRGGDAGLWWVPLSGGEPQRVSEGLLRYRGLSGAPQARRLVFEGLRDRSQILPAAAVPAGEGEFRDWAPDVAPDGTLLFVSTRSSGQQLWVRRGSEAPRQLTQGPGHHIASARWSPDGRRILYADARGGVPDLYLVDRSGSAPVRLTRDLAEERSPQWSADGRSIYYVSRAQGRLGLWRRDLTGTSAAPRLLGWGPSDVRLSPDGRWLYYRLPGRSVLYRRALGPAGDLAGPVQPVTVFPASVSLSGWSVDKAGIILSDGRQLRRFDLASGRWTVLGAASGLHQRTPFAVGPGGLYLNRQSLKAELYGLTLD